MLLRRMCRFVESAEAAHSPQAHIATVGRITF